MFTNFTKNQGTPDPTNQEPIPNRGKKTSASTDAHSRPRRACALCALSEHTYCKQEPTSPIGDKIKTPYPINSKRTNS